MSKKGENITKRKDGRYEARYVKERDEFGRITKYGFIYAKSYLEVKHKREEKLKNIKNEIQNQVNQNENFKDSLILWLENKISIKESSYTNYYSIIYNKIIPFFKNVKLKSINEKNVIAFIKTLQSQKLGSKRIKDILLVLKQFLKSQNIFIKFETPKVTKKKIVTLNNKELSLIESKALQSNDIKIFAILVVLFTGLRIGELCALKWEDIDLENKIIHITKTLIRVKNKNPNSLNKTKIIIDVPKTENSIRDIPINITILPYLKKFQKEDDCYFLTGNKSFITTKKYYLFYLKYLQSLNISKKSFHILRHTFATRCLLCGMDIKTLSEILGHSSVKTTLDLYVHIKEEEKLEQMNKLALLKL